MWYNTAFSAERHIKYPCLMCQCHLRNRFANVEEPEPKAASISPLWSPMRLVPLCLVGQRSSDYFYRGSCPMGAAWAKLKPKRQNTFRNPWKISIPSNLWAAVEVGIWQQFCFSILKNDYRKLHDRDDQYGWWKLTSFRFNVLPTSCNIVKSFETWSICSSHVCKSTIVSFKQRSAHYQLNFPSKTSIAL